MGAPGGEEGREVGFLGGGVFVEGEVACGFWRVGGGVGPGYVLGGHLRFRWGLI